MKITYTKPKGDLVENAIDAILFGIGAGVLFEKLGILATVGIFLVLQGRNFNLGKFNIKTAKENKDV